MAGHRGPLGGGWRGRRRSFARESEVNLAVSRNGGRALGVEAPEAVVAALAQESGTVGAQVAFALAYMF